ncbi:MAG: PAS domain-containing protein, partial [Acidobacteria bacterium]|nr:PAS domain-containing protein [Acidobacteriota bacterium]
AKEQAQEQHDRLQMIIDCMRDAVLFVTVDGVVRLRNEAADTLLRSENTSEADLKVCHPPERWSHFTEKLVALAERSASPMEPHPVLQINGRFYEASYARVRDSAGKSQGIVWVARDVTERMEMQQCQMQAERMAVVGKLAAALAHELNNPLGTAALFTQYALTEVKHGDPLADHLRTALRNVDRCKKIVRDLLQYAHHRAPERREVLIQDVLDDVVRTLQPQAQPFGVTIRCEMDTDPGILVYGDADQIRQIFINLGLNSIEAMPSGGLLTFRLAESTGGSVQIAVSDTGIGIPPAEHERIFAAFHTTKSEGTGFGLTVARDFVAGHSGTIEVQSAPGHGSTFTVNLPSIGGVRPAKAAS